MTTCMLRGASLEMTMSWCGSEMNCSRCHRLEASGSGFEFIKDMPRGGPEVLFILSTNRFQ